VESYAPEHKDFSTSTSLKCRVAFAAGAHSVTLKGVVSMYCKLVGIDMTFARHTFLRQQTETTFTSHSNYDKQPATKRKRAAGKKEKQKVAFKAKKKDKKDGTEYLSGIRLNGRIDDVHEQTHKGENLCFYYLFIHLCIYEIQYSFCIILFLRKLTFVPFSLPDLRFRASFQPIIFSMLTRIAISRIFSTNQNGKKIRWESCRFESQKLKLPV
jgi:hypothetical protein